MPYPSRTARSRLTFELSRQTGSGEDDASPVANDHNLQKIRELVKTLSPDAIADEVTAVEFINEMLQQCKSKWGDIEVWADNKPLGYKRINYKRGELLEEIPEAWQYKEVTKVIAAGGWGNMDYRIYVKA